MIIVEVTKLKEELEKSKRLVTQLRATKSRLLTECDKMDDMEATFEKELEEKNTTIAQIQVQR